MIEIKDLNRCIDILSRLHANARDTEDKRLILEIGYIIKQELDTVKAWETSGKANIERGRGNIDVRKLLEDNTQLFNENKKLQEIIGKMKETIDSRIPNVEKQMEGIRGTISIFQDTLRKI